MPAAASGEAGVFRVGVISALVLVVMTPVGLILYQSFLDNPFFDRTARLSLEAYEYVLTDGDYWRALGTTAVFAFLALCFVVVSALIAIFGPRSMPPGRVDAVLPGSKAVGLHIAE